MEKYFCCPECGSKKLLLVNEKIPFSWAKAIVGWIFLGVLGLLFGFLGQDNIVVSSWRCEECRNRFQDPNEMKRSIEKNEKAFDMYFKYYFIILILCSILIVAIISVYGLAFSYLINNSFIILVFFFIILCSLVALFIPYFIIKYFVLSIISSKKEEFILIKNKMKTNIRTGNNVTKVPTKIRYVRDVKNQTNDIDIERDANGLWHLPDDEWQF